jgi:cytochrome c oxidase subunit 2
MKSFRKTLLAAALATSLSTGLRAENRFDYCLLCHGAAANGNAGIRGTPAGDAPGHEMGPVGLRVKEEGALADAVSFVGGLPSGKPAPTIAGDPKHGKQLYDACGGCHGAKAEGNAELQAPALAARSDWYHLTHIRNFRDGLGGADERDTYGAQIRAIVAALPDEKAITDVVAYINTL